MWIVTSHAARQLPSWLIFDVRQIHMKTTKIVLAAFGVIAVVAVALLVHERQIAREANVALVSSERAHATQASDAAALNAKLAAAEQRAKSAEDDNATLLKAIADFRAAQQSAMSSTALKGRDSASLSREAALAELTSAIEKMEAKARSKPGYRPYQPPIESLLLPSQRKSLEEVRAEAKRKNQFVYSVFGEPGGTVFISSPFSHERVIKAYPQLTREDWSQLNERYARAMAESEIADWPRVPTPKK